MDKNYFGITDTGKVRTNNEDTFIAEPTGDRQVIACVIDGVGGYSGGEVASAIARESILQHMGNGGSDLTALMRIAIADAEDRIMAEKLKVKEYENMACVLTLALVDLANNQFHYAHVGDTRLYLLRDNTLVKISKDQSFVGFMEDSGRLTEEQAMRHPKRNEINKAIGFGVNATAQQDYLEVGQSPFLPGDLLLLCSDGLSDMVNRQEMTDILLTDATLEVKGKLLISAANKNGGLDNITAVLVKNDKQSIVHEATKPAVKKTKINATPVTVSSPASVVPVVSSPAPALKSSKGLITLLSLLCLLFLGVIVYLVWHNSKTIAVTQQKLAIVKTPRNAQEIRLQDTLNKLKGNTLILSDSLYKSPLVITEPLQFNQDTLYIIADKQLVIKSDSLYSGSAIRLKPLNKQLFMQRITFQDFSTAILALNNSVLLRDVQFVNCQNAIQSNYSFPAGKFIKVKIPYNTFKIDSLPTHTPE